MFSLSTFAPENLVSRDRFGGHVPRQPVLIPHTQTESIVLCSCLQSCGNRVGETKILPCTVNTRVYLVHRHISVPRLVLCPFGQVAISCKHYL